MQGREVTRPPGLAWVGLHIGFGKKFSLQEASGTLLIGAISGAIAGFEKKDLTKPEDWYGAATTVVLAELVLKAVWRNVAPKIAKVVSTFKGVTPS